MKTLFYTNLISWSGFNPHPNYIVAFLDKDKKSIMILELRNLIIVKD